MSDNRISLSLPKAHAVRRMIALAGDLHTQIATSYLAENTRLDRPGDDEIQALLTVADAAVLDAKEALEAILEFGPEGA